MSDDGAVAIAGCFDASVKVCLSWSLYFVTDAVNLVTFNFLVRDHFLMIGSGVNHRNDHHRIVLQLYDLRGGKLIRSLEGHFSYVNAVAISADGQLGML